MFLDVMLEIESDSPDRIVLEKVVKATANGELANSYAHIKLYRI